MTWRLTGHEKTNGLRTSIHCLVALPRSDLNPFPALDCDVFPLDLHRQLTLQDVKELTSVLMEVPRLARAGRHAFLDDVQRLAAHQIPPIAVLSPGVMLGMVRTDHCRHIFELVVLREAKRRF